jgi:hypothetical protein
LTTSKGDFGVGDSDEKIFYSEYFKSVLWLCFLLDEKYGKRG